MNEKEYNQWAHDQPESYEYFKVKKGDVLMWKGWPKYMCGDWGSATVETGDVLLVTDTSFYRIVEFRPSTKLDFPIQIPVSGFSKLEWEKVGRV